MKYTCTLLYSKEWTTQRDPLSVAFYADEMLPMIVQLKNLEKWIQAWYADDVSSCGKLTLLSDWFENLMFKGPTFGYFPEPSKSVLVVAECDIPATKQVFDDLAIKIYVHLLGGHVGSSEGRIKYVQGKVDSWA